MLVRVDDGNAAFHGRIELGQSRLVPLAETEAENERVGAVEGFGLPERSGVVRIDHTIIVGKKDDRVEAMTLGQKAGEHRHGLFGAVLFVAGKQDDGLACAGALATGEIEPAGAGSKRIGGQQERRRKDKGSGSGPAGEGMRHGVMNGETAAAGRSCKRAVGLGTFIFGHFLGSLARGAKGSGRMVSVRPSL